MFVEARDAELSSVEAVQKPVSDVLAKIDLAFEDSETARKAEMICPSFGLL